MKTKLSLLYALCVYTSIVACDDGHVDDPVFENNADGYNVQITGTFKGVSTWTGNYSVVAAAFDGESDYSLIQKVLPSTGEALEMVRLSNIPAQSKTVEIAVVNSLRKRIATLYSYELPESYSDTIRIDAGEINAGMFEAINRFVFQGSGTNCSMCHGRNNGAANLNLTLDNAYASLVNVQASKDRTKMRVLPGDAANSFFYKVITEGDDNVSYSHQGLFSEEEYSAFLDIIALWINNGAKE